MEALAVVTFFTTLNAIIGIINGFRPAYREAGKLLSEKEKTEGEEKFNKITEWLRWVERRVREELNHREKSKCSETSITADLKPLYGEVTEAWSLVKTWQNKNCWGKRLALKEFEEKWEKSEKAIRHRLEEFWSYTHRYEETQRTSGTAKRTPHTSGTAKHTTQHTNISVKNVNTLVLINGNVNVNDQSRSPAPPYNRHQPRVENGKENRPTTKEMKQRDRDAVHRHGHQRKREKQNGAAIAPTTKEMKQRDRDAVHGHGHQRKREKQNGAAIAPTTKKKVEKSNNVKPQRIKEVHQSVPQEEKSREK